MGSCLLKVIIYLLCGGKYEPLFIVKFSLVEYYVHEIFDGYLMDNSHFTSIGDVGICKFFEEFYASCMYGTSYSYAGNYSIPPKAIG